MNQMLVNLLKHMLPTSGDYRVMFGETKDSATAARWYLHVVDTATNKMIFHADFEIPKG